MIDVYELLKQLGYPVFLQGSLNSAEDYPEAFYTFWEFEAPELSYYDDTANKCNHGYWIYFYSNDRNLVITELEKARKMLIENGFTSSAKPIDVASDRVDFTGKMIEVYLLENL